MITNLVVHYLSFILTFIFKWVDPFEIYFNVSLGLSFILFILAIIVIGKGGSSVNKFIYNLIATELLELPVLMAVQSFIAYVIGLFSHTSFFVSYSFVSITVITLSMVTVLCANRKEIRKPPYKRFMGEFTAK